MPDRPVPVPQGRAVMDPRVTIRSRLALAVVLTALIPMLASVWLARSMVRQATARFFVPEVGVRLDQSLSLYRELATAIKARMRQQAVSIARHPELLRALRGGDPKALRRALEEARARHPDVASLTVTDGEEQVLARSRRAQAVDPERENRLDVIVPLGPQRAAPRARTGAEEPMDDVGDELAAALDLEEPEEPEEAQLAPATAGSRLEVVFVADRARFDELEEMSRFVDAYKRLEKRRGADEQSYLLAFAALLGITIVAAITVGVLLARGVSRRISELAGASRAVGRGDLTVRVPTRGQDEVTELAKAFNHMVREVASSRARIEYLQRMGTWQEMARRLAHEIKNPLTPIQLAVQEIHRRCPEKDPAYRRLVDTTLEVVEDEVATLRRLVSEFSEFARMPRADLAEEDLALFLREQVERVSAADGSLPEWPQAGALDVPGDPCPVLLDRQMFRRVLLNLLDNAQQSRDGEVQVRIALQRVGDRYLLDVEDDGPGIPELLRGTIFEPYVTGKREGTGLGLAIVKKIIVEHGGSISAEAGSLGGARLRIELPVAGSPESLLLLEEQPPASSQDAFRSADSMHYVPPVPPE